MKMKEKKSYNLGVSLFFIILLALSAAWLIYFTICREDQIVAQEGKDKASSLVSQAVDNQFQLNQEAKKMVKDLAGLPEVKNKDINKCNNIFSGLLKDNPRYTNFGVLDKEGNLFCSALPFDKPINASDRLFFQRVLATRDFSIGKYQIGNITKKPTISFGFPVLSNNNEVESVVFTSLDLNWLNLYFTGLNLPTDSILLMTDYANQVLVRYPSPDNWIGRYLPDTALMQAAFINSCGTFESSDPDGVKRSYAYAPFPGNPDSGRAYISIGLINQNQIWALKWFVDRRIIWLELIILAVFVLEIILIYRLVIGYPKKRRKK